MEVLKAPSTNCSKHQRDELTLLATLYPDNAPAAFRAGDLVSSIQRYFLCLRNLGKQGGSKKGREAEGKGPKTKESFKSQPPTLNKTRQAGKTVVHAWDPRTWKTEAGGSGEAILKYTMNLMPERSDTWETDLISKRNN